MKLSYVTLVCLGFATSLIAEGDAENGASLFRQCASCHSNEEGKRKVGPSLFGIVEREVGTIEGFRYSSIMADDEFIWEAENLSEFIADPKGYLPGTKMSFRGMRDEADRDDLIAYLATLQ